MKKFFLFFTIAAYSVTFAQTSLPKLATDVAPLLIGETIPNLNLMSMDNKSVAISELTKDKKTILVFYRGGWCPYCNAHLSALADAEKELIAQGYQIIAISPDAPKNLAETQSKDKVNYMLLSDGDGAFAKAFGIAFQAPDGYAKYLEKGSEGQNKGLIIPVPSLFIVGKEGTILFEYIAPDFKHRITNELLMSVVKTI